MSKSLSFALVLSAGTIDREASLSAAEVALDKYISEHETEQSTISDAVHAVFDQYKGASLTMPTIGGMTLRQLNAQPGNYKSLEKRVLDFVRANAGTRESGASFSINKGVGGGVLRLALPGAEIPARPAKKSA